MDHFCYLCFVSDMLYCLFIAAFWSPDEKGLRPFFSMVMFYCVLVTIPCGVLSKVWYLIVSLPDICLLSNFNYETNKTHNEDIHRN